MTSTIIKTQETELINELKELSQKFPNWKLFYEFNDSITNPVEVVKSVIKEMKTKFPNYKFSISRNSYNSLLILNIKPVDKDETFSYFGGSSCGYIVCNNMYRTIINEFKNNNDIKLFDIRVFDYCINSKTLQLEFKKY